MNYVYILRCADGSLYTGWTNDLKKRVKTHNAGKGAKYTKTRLPVELVYYEEYEEKGEALSRILITINQATTKYSGSLNFFYFNVEKSKNSLFLYPLSGGLALIGGGKWYIITVLIFDNR